MRKWHCAGSLSVRMYSMCCVLNIMSQGIVWVWVCVCVCVSVCLSVSDFDEQMHLATNEGFDMTLLVNAHTSPSPPTTKSCMNP